MLSFGRTVLGTDLKFNDTEEKPLFLDHASFEINSLKRFFFQEWKKKNPTQKLSFQLTLAL